MAGNSNAPIIIKRKKVVAGGGHHGGAWKVAYADFVTAMMAFFLLMWLLGATNEKQRKGIADFFNPTIPVNRISGGGDGAFGGDSVFTEETLSQNGTGAGAQMPTAQNAARGSVGPGEASDTELAEVAEALDHGGGESMVSELLKRHIVTRISDEGLVVEMFDLPGAPLFADDAATPTDVLTDLTSAIAEVFALSENPVAIQGHTAARPIVARNRDRWTPSQARADRVRRMLAQSGLAEARAQRVTGFADRQLAVPNPLDMRNNRVEVILLRSRL